MDSYSILESFDHGLRDAVAFESPGPSASESGPSTRDAYEPRRCTKISLEYWNDIAQQVLTSAEPYLSRIAVPTFEPTRCFKTEGDVVNAAAVHLNNPVDIALDAVHENAIIALNEPIGNKSSRADRVYALRRSPARVFAVMEYKKANVIQPAQVSHAIRESSGSGRGWEVSVFEGNLRILLKQAVHYAKSYHTRYVCLFDYNSLLLLVLTDADIDYDQTVGDGGQNCYLTLVTDKRYMRRALLGFLEEAYQSREGGRPEGSRHTTGRGHEGSSSSYGGRRSDRRREDPRLTHY